MYKFNDLTGMTFGRLEVIEQNGRTSDRHILWKCKCECGKFANLLSRELRSGKTKSCGCLQKDKIREMRYRHGDRDSRLYSVWKTMKKRCENNRHFIEKADAERDEYYAAMAESMMRGEQDG